MAALEVDAVSLDFSRCRLPPFDHQREDTQAVLDHPFYFIASEMRTGKTKIIIDAAQFLYEAGVIDKVIVVAPAPVRDVWYDPELGEIVKHAWIDLPSKVVEYHQQVHVWSTTIAREYLQWFVTNYEFLVSRNRLEQLLPACGRKTLLVLDESSFVKAHDAQRTKACLQLRRACGRVVLLNGTPIFHSPLDLFSQGNILHQSILDCKYVTLFKSRYAVQSTVVGPNGKVLMNPWPKRTKQQDGTYKIEAVPVLTITGWSNLDDIQRRFAPYTVRRLQKDCLDLPPKLDPVTLTADLTPATWKIYKQMRDELVVWLKHNKVAVASHAATKVMRLAQITSGFLGGVEDTHLTSPVQPDNQTLFDFADLIDFGPVAPPPASGVQEIGREKLDVLLWFISQRLEADPNLHLVVWCRFRPELFRMLAAVHERFPQFEMGSIQGSQKKAERLRALSLLKPETTPTGPVFVGGIEGTGSFGLDMCAAHTCVTSSSGYSSGKSAQTLDRVYGPNQKFPIAYFNLLARGPKGQKTIDHIVTTARQNGQNIATWTSSYWIKVLTDE